MICYSGFGSIDILCTDKHSAFKGRMTREKYHASFAEEEP